MKAILTIVLLHVLQTAGNAPIEIKAIEVTDAVTQDADDPAIWIHPTDPQKSLIFGTDKDAKGGLYAFNLAGKTVQHIEGLERPNNVDIEYSFTIGGKTIDIAVVTERLKRRLKV